MTGNPKTPEFRLEERFEQAEIQDSYSAAQAFLNLSSQEARQKDCILASHDIAFPEGIGLRGAKFDQGSFARIESFRSNYDQLRMSVVHIYSDEEDVLANNYRIMIDFKDQHGRLGFNLEFWGGVNSRTEETYPRSVDSGALYLQDCEISQFDGHDEHVFARDVELLSFLVFIGCKSRGVARRSRSSSYRGPLPDTLSEHQAQLMHHRARQTTKRSADFETVQQILMDYLDSLRHPNLRLYREKKRQLSL